MSALKLVLLFLLVCVFEKSANSARHDHNLSGARSTGSQIGHGSASKSQLENADAALLMHCNVTGPCAVGRTAGQAAGQISLRRQDISCVLASPDASVRAQFKQNLTHAALLHKAGEIFATHRPCSTAQSGLSLAGFECMMLALLALSVPVMLWRRSVMSH
ncbi:hypothetical protein ABBQ38_013511 [Trebouxia sp. C0009 RCD-2024]